MKHCWSLFDCNYNTDFTFLDAQVSGLVSLWMHLWAPQKKLPSIERRRQIYPRRNIDCGKKNQKGGKETKTCLFSLPLPVA